MTTSKGEGPGRGSNERKDKMITEAKKSKSTINSNIQHAVLKLRKVKR